MTVPKRIASALIHSLKGGVVPRIGLPYITVGREQEIAALLHDVDIVAEGGAAFRFISGRYGSGKSFLMQTMRNHVMDRGFVVADADLSPERRLAGTHGQGLATYRELMANLACRTRPEGGALSLILDRWLDNLKTEVAESGISPGHPDFSVAVESRIRSAVASLSDMIHGFEFSRLLILYHRAVQAEDERLRSAVLKWFRGEYATRTETKDELGISLCITDADWYDYLKLFAAFLRGAGYTGLYIYIDELVNIYKLPNAITRQYNYEKLLFMYNDALQGKARYIGILMGATPQSIEDPRRGIFSYEALRSRLSAGRIAREGRTDLLSPILQLTILSPEEMLVLAEKLQDIHASLYGCPPRLNEAHLAQFVRAEYARMGAEQAITPREIIRNFIELLDILLQDPALSPDALLSDGFHPVPPAEEVPAQFAEFDI